MTTTAVSKKFSRLVGLVDKQFHSVSATTGNIPFALKMNGSVHTFGGTTPAFTMQLNNDSAVAALSTLDQNTIIEAYLNDDIEVGGDIMQALALRELFN